jgi:urea transport system permease protein
MTGGQGSVVASGALWCLLLALPAFLGEWPLSQLAQLFSYGIFALSLGFIWGQVGLLCFGHAIFFGAGAYVMALATKGMLFAGAQGTAVGLLLAAVVPSVLAFVAGWLMFRGRGLSGAYFAIVTLAAAAIVERIASHWVFIGGFNGLLDVPPLRVAIGGKGHDLVGAIPVYYVNLAAAFASYLILLVLERAPLGTVLRSVRDDEERTAYFGFDVGMYKTWSFAVSGAVAGLAGALFATQFGFVSPALIGVTLSTEVLIWVALGGREVLLAAFLGAIVVRSVESVLSERLGNYWLFALGILFTLSVILFPRGVFGKWLALPLPRRLSALRKQ